MASLSMATRRPARRVVLIASRLCVVCRVGDVNHLSTVQQAGDLVDDLADLRTHMKHVLSVRMPYRVELSVHRGLITAL